MKLTKTVADRIASGRKTQHRLPRRPADVPDEGGEVTVRDLATGEEIVRVPADHFAATDPTSPYTVGESIPITVMRVNRDIGYRRDKPEIPRMEGVQACRIRLTAVHAANLHEIDQRSAMAEGFKTTDDFLADWWERHPEGPGNPDHPVPISVWVLAFELDAEQRPRLLSRASDVNRGYTESPVTGIEEAGEAVEDRYLDRFATESTQDHTARLAREERRTKERALEDRLAAVKEAASQGGVDVTRQLLAIERRIDAAEHIVKKFGRAA